MSYKWNENPPPPHGILRSICSDGRCECDDCEQYWHWLPLAEQLTEDYLALYPDTKEAPEGAA